MAPQSCRLATGQIIRVCNYPAVNSSSESCLDSITSKTFLVGSVSVLLSPKDFIIDSTNKRIYSIDIPASFTAGTAQFYGSFQPKESDGNLVTATPIGIHNLTGMGNLAISFDDGFFRYYTYLGEYVDKFSSQGIAYGLTPQGVGGGAYLFTASYPAENKTKDWNGSTKMVTSERSVTKVEHSNLIWEGKNAEPGNFMGNATAWNIDDIFPLVSATSSAAQILYLGGVKYEIFREGDIVILRRLTYSFNKFELYAKQWDIPDIGGFLLTEFSVSGYSKMYAIISSDSFQEIQFHGQTPRTVSTLGTLSEVTGMDRDAPYPTAAETWNHLLTPYGTGGTIKGGSGGYPAKQIWLSFGPSYTACIERNGVIIDFTDRPIPDKISVVYASSLGRSLFAHTGLQGQPFVGSPSASTFFNFDGTTINDSLNFTIPSDRASNCQSKKVDYLSFPFVNPASVSLISGISGDYDGGMPPEVKYLPYVPPVSCYGFVSRDFTPTVYIFEHYNSSILRSFSLPSSNWTDFTLR